MIVVLSAFALSVCALLLAPALASAATGKITGKATDASTSSPISSLSVCAYTSSSFEFAGCDSTDSSGEYAIEGLEPGSYKVRFGYEEYEYSSNEYITQWYNAKASFGSADPVTVTSGGTMSGINASMLQRGKISGTVTDATTGGPINGIVACARSTSKEAYYYSECVKTNASGQYTVSRLRAGSYTVGFFSPYKWNETTEESELEGPNYVTQYYNGKAHGQEGDPVAVSDGNTTTAINAAMQPGATITGTVTDAVTGAALEGISVCAWGSTGAYCDNTDAAGHYAVQTAPAGSYKVEFDPEHWYIKYNKAEPEKEHWQRSERPLMDYLRQYYNDKFSFEAAEAITATGGATTSGIDAKMTKEVQPPPPVGVAKVGPKAKVKGGKALLQVQCTGTGACSGLIKLSARAPKVPKKKGKQHKKGGTVAIGKAPFSIPPGMSKTVAVKLNGKGKALVAQAGAKGLKATVAGTGVTKGSVTLKGAQHPKKKN